MQGLAAAHVEKIKYEYVGITGKLADTLGRLPMVFRMVIFGDNGNGKTEFGFLIMEELQKKGRVDWISYEQGHGPDIQETIKRHEVKKKDWNVVFYDPLKNRHPDKTLYQELDEHLAKPKSAKFIVIDSSDACEFSIKEYRELHRKYGKRKAFIWLSYEGGNKKPKTALARAIGGEGDYIIRVSCFIATINKSRHGGWEDYIIWLERAREKNPLYFELKEREERMKATKEKKQRKSPKPITKELIQVPELPTNNYDEMLPADIDKI